MLTRLSPKRRRPELPKVSREKKFKLLMLKRSSNPLFSKTNTKRILLPRLLMPTTFSSDLEPSRMMMMKFHPEEEEVEEVAVEVKSKEVELEDKTQNKRSRRLRKISQPYEREGLF